MTTFSRRSAPSNPRRSATTPGRHASAPKPGEVIAYRYVWEQEYRDGRDEAVAERPVVVILVTRSDAGGDEVHVAPITSRPPRHDQRGIAIPPSVRRQLGLPVDRSWIIVSECNRFTWPGADATPIT